MRPYSNHACKLFWKIGCPDCGHAFVVEALIDETEHIEDEDFQVIDPATGFLYGLFGPASIPVIAFALAMTGIFESSSPGLMGLTLFMYSLCIWPIIGFVIAASSNTFVKVFVKVRKSLECFYFCYGRTVDFVSELGEWWSYQLNSFNSSKFQNKSQYREHEHDR